MTTPENLLAMLRNGASRIRTMAVRMKPAIGDARVGACAVRPMIINRYVAGNHPLNG